MKNLLKLELTLTEITSNLFLNIKRFGPKPVTTIYVILVSSQRSFELGNSNTDSGLESFPVELTTSGHQESLGSKD